MLRKKVSAFISFVITVFPTSLFFFFSLVKKFFRKSRKPSCAGKRNAAAVHLAVKKH